MKKAIFIFVTLLVAAGCRKEPVPGGRPDTGVPMTFGVASVESMQGTKAMIEDINDLEASCTPVTISPFVLNESIGVWADYEYLGTTFNNLLSNVELAFYDKTGGNTDGWNYNYGKDEEYWQMGGIYYFRAYYPQKAIKDAIISTSSAKTFIVNYNTEGIQVNIIVSFNVILTNKKCIEYVEDAYSVKNELEASFAELNTISTKGICLDTLMLSFMADTFIEDSFTVCDSYVDGIIAKYNKDKNTFEISAEFNAILRLSDNSYAYISRTYSNEVKSRKEISFTPEVAEACLLSASALQADDNRIKFIADVNILLWGCNYCKVNVLTDATVSEKLVSSSDGIIIYYADKNERIWDIAKSNGSSAESIKKLNGIADDVLLENKMLIIAK